MTSLVTGGTGFVGAHIVRALLARGESVRCLVRAGSRRDNLAGLDVELAVGDLRDPESLVRAVEGCAQVYHCAADYRLWVKNPEELYDANVGGTESLLRASREVGVEKVVYTSSVGALGLEADGTPANEDTPVSIDRMIGHYKRSKFLAERAAEDACRQGLPVVIVNPSTPVGDLDIKPTPTGQIVLDFLNRRMPAYVDTGLNLVDVRDVAAGHLAAADRGEVGEKYILGNRNVSLREMLEILSGLTGLAAPRVQMPHWVPAVFAAGSAAVARVTGREPRVSPESVRMSRYKMYFDASKAVRCLELPQTPVEEALERAVSWFRDAGYVSP